MAIIGNPLLMQRTTQTYIDARYIDEGDFSNGDKKVLWKKPHGHTGGAKDYMAGSKIYCTGCWTCCIVDKDCLKIASILVLVGAFFVGLSMVFDSYGSAKEAGETLDKIKERIAQIKSPPTIVLYPYPQTNNVVYGGQYPTHQAQYEATQYPPAAVAASFEAKTNPNPNVYTYSAPLNDSQTQYQPQYGQQVSQQPYSQVYQQQFHPPAAVAAPSEAKTNPNVPTYSAYSYDAQIQYQPEPEQQAPQQLYPQVYQQQQYFQGQQEYYQYPPAPVTLGAPIAVTELMALEAMEQLCALRMKERTFVALSQGVGTVGVGCMTVALLIMLAVEPGFLTIGLFSGGTGLLVIGIAMYMARNIVCRKTLAQEAANMVASFLEQNPIPDPITLSQDQR